MGSRKSVPLPYMPTEEEITGQIFMLHDDFGNRVIPHRNVGRVYVISSENIADRWVEEALELDSGPHGVDGFIESVARGLLRNHEVWIEILLDGNSKDQLPFQVCEVNGVKRTAKGNLIQVIPDEAELPEWFQAKVPSKQILELDPDLMVQVTLPEAYPSELLNGVVGALADVKPFGAPKWALEGSAGLYRDGPRYNPKEADRTERLFTLQAAHPIGWAARESLLGESRQINEYYLDWRELRFLHFVASMRARAESGLREVLRLAGKRCGFTASVTAHGVYTPEEVCGFMRQFQSGELSLTAVDELIFQRTITAESKQRRVV